MIIIIIMQLSIFINLVFFTNNMDKIMKYLLFLNYCFESIKYRRIVYISSIVCFFQCKG